uniref:Uncharacterized protein n=1 Tax=Caenorhabditis japonica TaxID=281687 RepID=A0A8R1IPL1_CAEJA
MVTAEKLYSQLNFAQLELTGCIFAEDECEEEGAKEEDEEEADVAMMGAVFCMSTARCVRAAGLTTCVCLLLLFLSLLRQLTGPAPPIGGATVVGGVGAGLTHHPPRSDKEHITQILFKIFAHIPYRSTHIVVS